MPNNPTNDQLSAAKHSLYVAHEAATIARCLDGVAEANRTIALDRMTDGLAAAAEALGYRLVAVEEEQREAA